MTEYKLTHLLLIITLILFSLIGLQWFFHVYVPNPFPNKESYSLLSIYIIILSVTAFVFQNKHSVFLHRQIGFRQTPAKYILLAVVIAFSIWGLDYFYQNHLLIRNITQEAMVWRVRNNNLTITFISTVIFAPIIEEMLLRGIFLQTVNQYLSKFWSAFIISLLFAALHLSWIDAFPLFIASMFYAWLTFKSNSIVPAIIAHILNNCFTFIYYLLLIDVI